MPAIRQYENQTNAVQLSDTAASSTARAAQSAEIIGRELGRSAERASAYEVAAYGAVARGINQGGEAVMEWQAGKELQELSANLMKAHEELDKDWSQTRGTTDPNKPAGQDWREQKMVPRLDALLDGVSTKKARDRAAALIDSAKMSYLHTTRADDEAAAGSAAVKNLDTVVNAATLRSNRDFSTVEYNNQVIRETMEASIASGNFSPRAQVKLREMADKAVMENQLAGLKGAAERNPGAFVADLKAGRFDTWGIDNKDKDALLHYAKTQARAKEMDGRIGTRQANAEVKKRSQTRADEYLKGMVDPNTGELLPMTPEITAKILNDPDMLPAQKTSTIRFLSGALKAPKVDNYATRESLQNRVGDVDDPTTVDEVSDALAAGQLTRLTASDIIRNIRRTESAEGRERNNFERGATQTLKAMTKTNDPFSPPSPDAAQDYEQRRLQLRDYIQQQRKAGTPDREIFDREGKAYWGKQPFATDAAPKSVDPLKKMQEDLARKKAEAEAKKLGPRATPPAGPVEVPAPKPVLPELFKVK